MHLRATRRDLYAATTLCRTHYTRSVRTGRRQCLHARAAYQLNLKTLSKIKKHAGPRQRSHERFLIVARRIAGRKISFSFIKRGDGGPWGGNRTRHERESLCWAREKKNKFEISESSCERIIMRANGFSK